LLNVVNCRKGILTRKEERIEEKGRSFAKRVVYLPTNLSASSGVRGGGGVEFSAKSSTGVKNSGPGGYFTESKPRGPFWRKKSQGGMGREG